MDKRRAIKRAGTKAALDLMQERRMRRVTDFFGTKAYHARPIFIYKDGFKTRMGRRFALVLQKRKLGYIE